MILGLMRVELRIPESRSLKDKRMVIKSLKDKIRNEFNVSVSEVGDQDLWSKSEFGVAAVGTDTKYVNQVLSGVIEYIQRFPRVQVVDYCIQML